MRHFCVIFIALFVFAFPTFKAAKAQLLHFEWEGGALNNNAIDSSSWYQDSDPTPILISFMYFTQVAVTGGVGHVTGNINGSNVNFTENFTSVRFFQRYSNDPMSGGFSDGMDGMSSGLQLYTGSETNPSFSPGFFLLDNGNLNVTAVNGVPECSTWAMMLLGFSGFGFLAKRRLRRRTHHIDFSPRNVLHRHGTTGCMAIKSGLRLLQDDGPAEACQTSVDHDESRVGRAALRRTAGCLGLISAAADTCGSR